MSMRSLPSTHLATLNGLDFEQAQTFLFTPKLENARTLTRHSEKRVRRGANPPSRRGALQERLDKVEREIEMYIQIDGSEKARFNRESYLWTAEDRIEWQETQLGNAERLQELLKERSDLQEQLRQ
ncbi:hypothetical protein NLM27_18205 [Bradyrhizobium sp. CCGB12]|uniref:hypothetical protein n=1 Tax=Bradyrhizobium sp. CCGB12 TaxID=2949632 RepID=UPI0020B2C3B1|nr:hypothetical protein [Bradyrhizobium sp. CCGB12]MCP3390715.1 hypothetical protein [Bradyrhizobium sp. CCGB12]